MSLTKLIAYHLFKASPIKILIMLIIKTTIIIKINKKNLVTILLTPKKTKISLGVIATKYLKITIKS